MFASTYSSALSDRHEKDENFHLWQRSRSQVIQ